MFGMTQKVLIVGLNPSNRKTINKVNKNSTFDRLNKWMNHCGIEHYSFINCINDRGNYINCNVDYDSLKTAVVGYKKILALGDIASKSLININVDHFRLPHPSPRNRVLNDSVIEKIIIELCREYVYD